MKVGDLVRYTPDGKIDDRWSDWYGLAVRPDPQARYMMIVRWNDGKNTIISIRKKDLTVVNSV